jgi:hypothetical protein
MLLSSRPGDYEGILLILIHPPVAKPGEPPAGIARLAGALNRHGIPCLILDANIEGLLYLMQQPVDASDTWSRRAIRHASEHIAALQDPKIYQFPARYARAVRDVQRVLTVSARGSGATVGLADYQHEQLSPVRSADLIQAAAHPRDNPFYPFFQKRLPALIEQGKTGMVGISLNYLSQALCAFALIGYIRTEHPGMKVVLGGGLVSSWMQKTSWENPFGELVDHLLAGPGEHPLLKLLGRNQIAKGPGRPDYRSLPRHDYLAPGFILPYSAASGCYWGQCSFCPEKAEDNPYRPHAPEQVMIELHDLIEERQPVLLHLLDNAISPALLRALTEQPPGVPWYGFVRIGRELTNDDYCLALKRAGCVMLKLGLESGDQGVINAMNKGIEVDMASQVLKSLKRAGIATYVYLLFGSPQESVTEARRTLDFVVKHREEITFLNLAVFNMPICGPEAGDYATRQFYAGDLSLYTGFQHPRGWDRKSIRRFLNNEFTRHSAVAEIMARNPPVFTSNHAAFFI